jgi:hypothetical protein
VQSARSGKQNIAEGSKASRTSSEMELKLTNVARASLEQLLLDYYDFLRTRDHPAWDKNSKEALSSPHRLIHAPRRIGVRRFLLAHFPHHLLLCPLLTAHCSPIAPTPFATCV